MNKKRNWVFFTLTCFSLVVRLCCWKAVDFSQRTTGKVRRHSYLWALSICQCRRAEVPRLPQLVFQVFCPAAFCFFFLSAFCAPRDVQGFFRKLSETFPTWSTSWLFSPRSHREWKVKSPFVQSPFEAFVFINNLFQFKQHQLQLINNWNNYTPFKWLKAL